MKIIKHREHHTETHYEVFYHFEGQPGNGFGFSCDLDHVVDEAAMNPNALANYRDCQSGVVSPSTTCPSMIGQNIVGPFYKQWEQSWHTPGVGLCEVCGHEVELEGFTCTCDHCGADYNSSGQRLAPRECWGEETGEHPADVARIR